MISANRERLRLMQEVSAQAAALDESQHKLAEMAVKNVSDAYDAEEAECGEFAHLSKGELAQQLRAANAQMMEAQLSMLEGRVRDTAVAPSGEGSEGKQQNTELMKMEEKMEELGNELDRMETETLGSPLSKQELVEELQRRNQELEAAQLQLLQHKSEAKQQREEAVSAAEQTAAAAVSSKLSLEAELDELKRKEKVSREEVEMEQSCWEAALDESQQTAADLRSHIESLSQELLDAQMATMELKAEMAGASESQKGDMAGELAVKQLELGEIACQLKDAALASEDCTAEELASWLQQANDEL